MKKVYTLLSFLFLFSVAKAQFPAPYCSEEYVDNVEPITSVVFGSISNTSSDVTGGDPLEDYTSISTNVTQGLSYPISVQGNTDGSTYTDYIRVFIDWNQDGDFDDAGESYDIGTIKGSTGLDGKTATANIVVPIDATLGLTRMRVTKHWDSYQNPCNAGGFLGEYGESEDYSITVVVSPNCSGTPPTTTASGPSSSCSDSLIVVSLSGITAGTGLTYQWQTTTLTGTVWTDIAGDTTSTATITHPAGGARYRCIVKCTSSGISTPSTEITVQSINCAPPVNDEACNAITLVLDGPSDCQNTKYATSTSEDPSGFSCSTPNNTTWYKYTPTTSGMVQFTLAAPAAGDTLYGWLGVFTASGSCPGSLTFTDVTSTTLGSCTSFGAAGDVSTVFAADLVAGTEYYFMVDGVSGAIGQYCISIQTPPNPPTACPTNILPANNAVDVSAPSATIKWSTVPLATSYDIYFGTTNPPSTTAIGSTTLDSALITGLAFNTTYYWYVAPKNIGGSATGCDANMTSFTTMAPPPVPINDLPCDAITLVLNGSTDCQNTVSATSTDDPSAFTCSTPNNTTWYKYTPTVSDSVQITLSVPASNNLDGWLGIYSVSGTCPSLTFSDITNTTLGACEEYGFNPSSTTKLTVYLDAGTEYYFMIDGVSGAVGEYCVSIQSKQPLPVNFTKFIGEKKGTNNLLSWTTATEINNKGFELQRSATGDNYLPLTFVETKATNGNSSQSLNYQATDNKPYSGNTYYRLKQVDKNGKSTFSNVILIKGDKASNISVTDVYPNPANKLLNMIVASPNDEKITIIISDITGKIVQKQASQVISGNNALQLEVGSLSSGSYLLKVVCNNGCSSSIIKFIKQ